ncbi:hypothetical protein [Kribbella sp. NBC_00382]|uniref:hypothetical protein n=1 Tax=Kribbella sp. NBC_00382 TaxID=2975967 RepID=UPI003FA523F8
MRPALGELRIGEATTPRVDTVISKIKKNAAPQQPNLPSHHLRHDATRRPLRRHHRQPSPRSRKHRTHSQETRTSYQRRGDHAPPQATGNRRNSRPSRPGHLHARHRRPHQRIPRRPLVPSRPRRRHRRHHPHHRPHQGRRPHPQARRIPNEQRTDDVSPVRPRASDR